MLVASGFFLYSSFLYGKIIMGVMWLHELKNIKKRLSYVIFSTLLMIVIISMIFEVHYIKMQNNLKQSSYDRELNVSMQIIEDAMVDIENMIITECQKDANIKKIIKSRDELERLLAMQKKKDIFVEDIKKYQYLDGIFLYESKKQSYVEEVSSYITYEEQKSIKNHLEEIIERFDSGYLNNLWMPFQIGQEYYLLRMIKFKSVYVCAWIKPEHIINEFNKKEPRDIQYILCDESGNILTNRKQFTSSIIDTDNRVSNIRNGKKYVVYKYHSEKKPYIMCMAVRENRMRDIGIYLVIPIMLIFMIGLSLMVIIHKIVGDIIIDPIHYIFLKEKSEKDEAKLQFLQLQMNPHFINNGLSLIRNLIVFEKYDEAENAVINLSDYTRNTLQPDTKVTIQREITQLQAWYEIQKMRLKQKIVLHFDIDSEALEEMIPTMLIYTFVENSVKHYGRKDDIQIYVQVKYKDVERAYLDIIIKDEGIGYPEEILCQLREGKDIIKEDYLKHIGISNIMKRTKILYGEHFTVELKNVEPHGAFVHFVIPVEED